MPLRFEAWTLPESGSFTRKVAKIPVETFTVSKRLSTEVGDMMIRLPSDDAARAKAKRILESDPFDRTQDNASLIRVWWSDPDDTSGVLSLRLIGEWYARRSMSTFTESGPIEIAGPHIDSVLDRFIVLPYDFPTSPSKIPSWQWGMPTLTRNHDLTDGTFAHEELKLWIEPTGAGDPSGSLSLTINGQTTDGFTWDASASDIKTKIDTAVTSITEAKVGGSGTPDDPWVLVLVDDEPTNQTVVANLGTIADGDVKLEIVTEGGNLIPAFWEPAQTIDGVEFGVAGGGGFTIVDDPAGGGGKALLIVGNSEFIGAQQILEVDPGSIGWSDVEVYTSDPAAEYRLVIRGLDEEFVASSGGSGGFEGISVPADTWTTIDIDSFTIPDGMDHVILRFAVVSAGNPADFYIRNLKFHQGFKPTNYGDALKQLVEDRQVDHGDGYTPLDWLTVDFTDTVDSDGNAWNPAEIGLSVDPGLTFRDVHDESGGKIGHELGIEWDAAASAHDLRLWNPGERGSNLSASISLTARMGITGAGPFVKSSPPFTHAFVQGADGRFVFTGDDAQAARVGRSERFIQLADVLSDSELAAAASRQIATALASTAGLTVELVDPTHVPGVDFDVGDTITVNFTDYHQQKTAARVVTWAAAGGRDVVKWTVSLSSESFVGEEARDRAVVRLLRKSNRVERGGRRGPVRLSGGTIQPRLLPAGSAPSGAFIHLARVATQTIAVAGEAISFDTLDLLGYGGFAEPALGTDIVIPLSGYWNVELMAGWTSHTAGGTVWITRTRGGVEETVWPSTHEPGIWAATDGQLFEGTAHAIPCRAGDILRIYIDADTASGEALASASCSVYLVDRIEGNPSTPSAFLITEEVPQTATTGDPWFDETFFFHWDGTSTIYIAGSEDGAAQWLIDNELELYVTHQDGSTNTFPSIHGVYPSAPALEDPEDVTAQFEPGVNEVRVVFRDYGIWKQASEIWITAP